MTGRQKPTITVPEAARWLTVADVSVVLGVSKMTVHRLVRSRDLRGYKIGNSIRVRADDLADYLRLAEVGVTS